MADQVGHHEPHRQPRDSEHSEIVGRDQRHHEQREHEGTNEEPVDSTATGHVAPRVAVDDPAEERDGHPHHDGQSVNIYYSRQVPRLTDPEPYGEHGEHAETHDPQEPHEPRQQSRHA